jgi:hypothetical protein
MRQGIPNLTGIAGSKNVGRTRPTSSRDIQGSMNGPLIRGLSYAGFSSNTNRTNKLVQLDRMSKGWNGVLMAKEVETEEVIPLFRRLRGRPEHWCHVLDRKVDEGAHALRQPALHGINDVGRKFSGPPLRQDANQPA